MIKRFYNFFETLKPNSCTKNMKLVKFTIKIIYNIWTQFNLKQHSLNS